MAESVAWMQTYTGRRICPTSLKPEDVDIKDIAHSLALTCRFSGHCKEFYSVAQHSVLVSGLSMPRHSLIGLLHDAGEAYLGDTPTPLAHLMGERKTLERACLAVIFDCYGLAGAQIPPEVKKADRTLLATECRDLMGSDPKDWGLEAAPIGATLVPWPAEMAERLFLTTFENMMYKPPEDK